MKWTLGWIYSAELATILLLSPYSLDVLSFLGEKTIPRNSSKAWFFLHSRNLLFTLINYLQIHILNSAKSY